MISVLLLNLSNRLFLLKIYTRTGGCVIISEMMIVVNVRRIVEAEKHGLTVYDRY